MIRNARWLCYRCLKCFSGFKQIYRRKIRLFNPISCGRKRYINPYSFIKNNMVQQTYTHYRRTTMLHRRHGKTNNLFSSFSWIFNKRFRKAVLYNIIFYIQLIPQNSLPKSYNFVWTLNRLSGHLRLNYTLVAKHREMI